MFSRWTATIILLCCGASLAAAAPRVPGKHADERTVIFAGSVKDHTVRWRHPKDVYSEFTRLDPRDCARYPASRYPECADLDTGGAEIGTDRYFTDPEMGQGPVTRSYPGPLPQHRSIPLRRSAGRPEFPRSDPGPQDERFLRGMAAQLLLVTFKGRAAPESGLIRMFSQLRQGEVGGVMIRAENVASASQLMSLSQLIAKESPREPLILIERPGASAAGSLPKPGFSPFPSPREIGDKGEQIKHFQY